LLYNSKKYINFMLIIEIILTIVAWRKGWNWLSLIPIGVAFCIGLILGASSQGQPVDVMTVVIWDILAIIALIVMVAVNPPGKKIEPPTPTPPPTI
jgi:uncharacterized membrane protein YfcA